MHVNCLSHFVTLTQWPFWLLSTVVTHHTLTLVSSSCNDAQSCDHASFQYHIVYCRHVHHSIMMNITWWCFDESRKQLTLGHMTTIFVVWPTELLRWLVETPSCDTEHYHMFTASRSPGRHYNVTWVTLKCRPGWRHVTFIKCKRKIYSTLFLFIFCLFFGILL